MLKKVLIANRGEIAVRIIRACRNLGISTVAVYSQADRDSLHVKLADQAICIGPPDSRRSYLNAYAVLSAAHACGADSIHPGYGFLSENAAFAKEVENSGLTFIGPSSATIEMVGDKVQAKAAMRRSGVPVVPGSEGALSGDDAAAIIAAKETGYPVIVKAAGGGGGRGMRVVERESDLLGAIRLTKAEALAAFNNDAVYLERYLAKPRHIEIQVLADGRGNAVWLGERDCSIQRRHQKVIEEAPAPGISRDAIAAIGQLCVRACIDIGYRGVGTFEFLYEKGEFFFIEMNTRVQVEHPVTEAITGIDIVAEQLRVAGGEPLTLKQEDIRIRGHAIECRLNAEDPVSFQPCPGVIKAWFPPGGPGIRIDSHAHAGYVVPPYYDSLIGKLIAHGDNRAQALARMRTALAELKVEGISTNAPVHQALLGDEAFAEGGCDIHYLERNAGTLLKR